MKRNFCIGSEWLYYKIYTGVKTADIVLLEKLYPIIEKLKSEKIIDKWFFIRYNDLHDHIRIRFFSKSHQNSAIVINQLYPVFNELLEQDIIWKIQADTYQRELERYGENTIEESETLFWLDSEMIIKYLTLKSSFTNLNTPLFFSFLTIDSFFNSFSLTNTEKLDILNNLQLSFKKEFDADKTLKKEFDKNYRELYQEMNIILTLKSNKNFNKLYKLVKEKTLKSTKVISLIQNNIQIPLLDFLTSHIHMMLNRQFTSKQRMYETLIYDQLHRYYKTLEFKQV